MPSKKLTIFIINKTLKIFILFLDQVYITKFYNNNGVELKERKKKMTESLS